MIRCPPPDVPLSPAERYGLETLVDLARLVPVDDLAADVVRVVIAGAGDQDAAADRGIPTSQHFAAGDGVVAVESSLLRWITKVAGAAAEQKSSARDRYGRVPASANPLVESGEERRPLVSLVAAAFRGAAVAVAGRRPIRLVTPWPRGRRWAAAITHDLDVVAWWPVFSAVRIAELARKGEMARVARAAAMALTAFGRQPIMTNVRRILATERMHGIRSTWFVLCGAPTWQSMSAGDLTYHPDSSAARRILECVLRDDHEIGLHGSFGTAESGRALLEQRAWLERIVSHPVHGVRQHFLRMRPGVTQQRMHGAGFQYDATYGFADRSGFRLGAADVLMGWDAEREMPSGLDEVPLTWMDRTMSKYQGVEDPASWIEDALATASTARSAEGLWVGLWHPNLCGALGFPGAPSAFEKLAAELSAHEPYTDTADALVRWRRARRAVRVCRVEPGGEQVLPCVSAKTPYPIVLEDEHGRPREEVAVRCSES